MHKKSHAAVLVSGGLDSGVLAWEMSRQFRSVTPIYIRQGLAWESVEIYWLRRFLKRLDSSALLPLETFHFPIADVYGRHWSTTGLKVPSARSRDEAVYLPGRNLALTLKAGIYCALRRIRVLALGSLGHNPFPDASPQFFQRWAKAMSIGLSQPITLLSPYRTRSKAEIIRRGRHLPLEWTFSCLQPQARLHCGRCNKCAERRRAFAQTRVADKTHYVN